MTLLLLNELSNHGFGEDAPASDTPGENKSWAPIHEIFNDDTTFL